MSRPEKVVKMTIFPPIFFLWGQFIINLSTCSEIEKKKISFKQEPCGVKSRGEKNLSNPIQVCSLVERVNVVSHFSPL